MNAPFEGRLVVTIPEAGKILGLGRDVAYAAAKRGEIPTLRFGKRIVVPVPKLMALLEPSGPPPCAEMSDLRARIEAVSILAFIAEVNREQLDPTQVSDILSGKSLPEWADRAGDER